MSATLGEIEGLFANTITSVKDTEDMMRTMIASQAQMAKAHADIGSAFTMMAKTFEKVEERQSQLELTNTNLYKEKGIPPTVFFLVSSTLCIVIILGAVWITDTFIKASFTSFEAGKKELSRTIESGLAENKKDIIEELKDDGR